MVNLPPIDYKPGKPCEHIESAEYHSLFEYEHEPDEQADNTEDSTRDR